MTTHILAGIQPTPLASYLAGLGLIRVLGEQADPVLTAWWADAGLAVDTTVDDLAAWLVDTYTPTPVLSPWNEGSGFGAKDRAPKDALDALLSHPSPRLRPFHAAHTTAAAVAAQFRSDAGWSKDRAVREFRNRAPEELLPWIDAAVVLADDQTMFPPLLGTGGNDGRLDFSTNYHQRLLELLDAADAARRQALGLAQDLLTGTQTQRLTAAAIGQFDPAGAGGRNSSPFGAMDSLVNPWSLVLLVEGALLFAATATRRNQHGAGRAAMPFTVQASAEGSGSGARGEASRGELWCPLWDKPFTLGEIKQIFTEARASWQGRPAQQAVEFYAATRTLGVARGIKAFTRFGLHQRNGLAYVAVPIEEVAVRPLPAVGLAARLETWVSWARRGAASGGVNQQIRRYDSAHMAFVRDGGPRQLLQLLATVTDVEVAIGRSGRARENLPPRQPPSAADFLPAMDEIRWPELRIAVGLASCSTVGGTQPGRSLRQILLPIDPRVPKQAWRDTPLIAGFGLRPLRSVLADVLAWRARTAPDEVALSAATAGETSPGARLIGVPTFRRGIRVPAADLHAFAAGEVDDDLLDLCLRACLALAWPRQVRPAWAQVQAQPLPVPLLGLLQPFADGLAPGGLHPDAGDVTRIALQPDWPAGLVAGQVSRVQTEAVRRLRQAGWQARESFAEHLDREVGVRIAAALVPRCLRPRQVLETYLSVPSVPADA